MYAYTHEITVNKKIQCHTVSVEIVYRLDVVHHTYKYFWVALESSLDYVITLFIYKTTSSKDAPLGST